MRQTSPTEELNQLITLKELQFRIEKDELIKEINDLSESLRPLNFLRQKLKNVMSETSPVSGIVNGALGYLSGILAKKIFVGKSESTMREIEGAILQMFISSKVSANADDLKSMAQAFFQKFMKKSE